MSHEEIRNHRPRQDPRYHDGRRYDIHVSGQISWKPILKGQEHRKYARNRKKTPEQSPLNMIYGQPQRPEFEEKIHASDCWQSIQTKPEKKGKQPREAQPRQFPVCEDDSGSKLNGRDQIKYANNDRAENRRSGLANLSSVRNVCVPKQRQ